MFHYVCPPISNKQITAETQCIQTFRRVRENKAQASAWGWKVIPVTLNMATFARNRDFQSHL